MKLKSTVVSTLLFAMWPGLTPAQVTADAPANPAVAPQRRPDRRIEQQPAPGLIRSDAKDAKETRKLTEKKTQLKDARSKSESDKIKQSTDEAKKKQEDIQTAATVQTVTGVVSAANSAPPPAKK